jgi:glycosyltransferase involved in cell wall biosynthesis
LHYLSIITVTYNDKSGFIQTRDSILPLPSNCEWIVIDANSNDGTREVLESLPQKSNITWLSESDNGIFDGMNKGIDIATGKYIAFMNSGDFYNRGVFEKVVAKESMAADIIMHNCFTVDENGNKGRTRSFPDHIEEIKEWACVQHQSTFYRKSIFKTLGKYRLEFKYLSDYEHSVRAFLDKNTTFALDSKTRLSYFLQGGVSTNLDTSLQVSKEYIVIQKKHFGSCSKKLYVTNMIKVFLNFLPYGDILVRYLRVVFFNKR